MGRALMRMGRGKIASFADAFDLVIPVPRHSKRLKKRGFNQSFIIAGEISRITGAPIDYGTLVKAKETEDQYMLSKAGEKTEHTGSLLSEGRHVLLRASACSSWMTFILRAIPHGRPAGHFCGQKRRRSSSSPLQERPDEKGLAHHCRGGFRPGRNDASQPGFICQRLHSTCWARP